METSKKSELKALYFDTMVDRVLSFSKIITIVWIVSYIETLLYVQVATIFSFGDVAALQYVLSTVSTLGQYVVPFYFCTKVVENLAKGFEDFLLESSELSDDEEDSDEICEG